MSRKTAGVDDTKLVLDRLSGVPPDSPHRWLVARLAVDRIGVFGHSMGGVTAGQFCLEDRRCRAGLNLDGIPQYGTMIRESMPRPFLMVYSARPGTEITNVIVRQYVDQELLGRRSALLAGSPVFPQITARTVTASLP